MVRLEMHPEWKQGRVTLQEPCHLSGHSTVYSKVCPD